MLAKYSFSFLFILLCLLGCERKLERPGVPIWLSIQLEVNESCDAQSWSKNASLDKLITPEGWIIEIPIIVSPHDSIAISAPEQDAISEAVEMLQSWQCQQGIHFLLENPHHISIDSISLTPYFLWLEKKLQQLRFFKGKIFFSGIWIQHEVSRKRLMQRLPAYQQILPEASFILAGRAEVLFSASFPWETQIEVGIIYDSPADEQLKPHFRTINRQLSELAGQTELFILQSNLLGRSKSLLYKNQLRFWDEEIRLNGLTINSLYCTHSLADSSSRFGMATDQQLIDLLIADY